MVRKLVLGTALCLGLTALPRLALAEDTFIYAVQLTATVLENPYRLALQWRTDPYQVNSYTVYRKSRDAASWGSPIATLGGEATYYEDWSVGAGQAYEYKVVKHALNHTGYGYIYAGIRAPMTKSRGKVVLVVAQESVQGLDYEVQRLEEDLAGDGWMVLRKTVSSNDTPAYVRSLIRSEYLGDPSKVNTVLLLGHVPVLLSGYLDYDGHQFRAMPADAYYGEMTEGVWPVDPALSPSYMPSEIELMVGRVDFFDMPGVGIWPAWPSEQEMLRNYLNKDHAWRHGTMTVPRRALMGNRRGDEDGEATAASGYRNFQPFVGHGSGSVVEADISNFASDYNRWINVLGREAYLFAYGCGGGLPQGISWLGTHGQYKEAWSRDVVAVDAKAVFVMLFGSWFAEWHKQDNFMRSFLLTSKGLGVCMAGGPHWFAHHSALGEPFGYGARLTMNNSGLYENQVNNETRAVFIAWLGDPTLRADIVRPISGLHAVRSSSGVSLSWTDSPDATEGYHVFRAPSASGPFSRLTGSPVTALTFTDGSPLPAGGVYMIRALKLENRFSGSYFNLSQGITVGAPPAPPVIQAARTPQGLALTWNTVPGKSYYVETRNSLQSSWTHAAGPLTASGQSLTWTNPIGSGATAFFRVVSP